MIKIYVPNLQDNLNKLGGGFTFLKNIHKGLNGKVEFVDNWVKCDIVFVFGITTIDKTELHNAINGGKKLVLRVDNIPRKSRNKRQAPAERLTEFGNKASMVIYQSEWCKEYAGYFIDNDNNCIINNGVDTSIFNTDGRNSNGKTYLYINYNDNPNKRFDEALYWFDMYWRKDNDIKLIIAGNAPRIYIDNPQYNWDVPTNANIEYVGVKNSPEAVAELMKKCDYLIYPSFAEAYPNTVLEALSCGMQIDNVNKIGGTRELIKKNGIGSRITKLSDMCNNYLEVFKKLID